MQDIGFIFRAHFFNLVQAAYNQFNLPDEMDFGSNRKINYTYNGSGQKIMRSVSDGINPVSYTNYVGMFVHEYTGSNEKTLKYIMTPEGRIMNTGTNSSPVWNWEYNLTDHLGNVRVVLTPAATAGYSTVLQQTAYYPYGMRMTSLCSTSGTDNDYLYNGKQLQTSYGLNWYDYGARFYDPQLGRWHSVDPMAESYYSQSPYHFSGNNPIKFVDLNGMNYDWVEKKDKSIYWDENAISQATTKQGEKYLGKNVLVGTHNRDANLNEPINSAKFELYLESNKEGPSATIMGNTVPADVEKYGTLAEGLYSAKSDHRSKYPDESALRILNLDGKDRLPTVNGNPNPNSDGKTLTGIFFHSAGNSRESLFWYNSNGTVGGPWTTGCQTTGSGPGRKYLHDAFMSKVGNFNGTYYLRRKE